MENASQSTSLSQHRKFLFNRNKLLLQNSCLCSLKLRSKIVLQEAKLRKVSLTIYYLFLIFEGRYGYTCILRLSFPRYSLLDRHGGPRCL